MHGDEARAKSLDAGEILVAARLVDTPLAPEFRFQGLDRHAIGDAPAISAAFADLRIDEGALSRVGPFAALAQAPPFGRARLVVQDDRHALEFAKFALRLIHRVAMAKAHAVGQRDAGVALRVVRHERHFLYALRGKLLEDLNRRHAALDRLPSSHRDEAVEENLVGDRNIGGERLADRERPRMRVGAVADISEHVILFGERLLAEPHHAFAAHMRSGGGLLRIDQRRHPMAADASKRAAALRHRRRTVMRASGAKARASHRRRAIAEYRPRRLGRAERTVRIMAGNRLGQDSGDEFWSDLAEIGNGQGARRRVERLPIEIFAHDPRRFRITIENGADLILEQWALLLDHDNDIETSSEIAHDYGIKGPHHADFKQTQPKRRAVVVEAEIAERL